MHTHTHAHTHTCMCICVNIHMYAHTYRYLHMYTHTYMHISQGVSCNADLPGTLSDSTVVCDIHCVWAFLETWKFVCVICAHTGAVDLVRCCPTAKPTLAPLARAPRLSRSGGAPLKPVWISYCCLKNKLNKTFDVFFLCLYENHDFF